MGMYDSILLDQSMVGAFPLADGTLCTPEDEWQTKDLTSYLRVVVLKDSKVYARYNDVVTEWPMTAVFEMYLWKDQRLQAEYSVSVKDGIIVQIVGPQPISRQISLDGYPFEEQEATDMQAGLDATIDWLKDLESKRTWIQKLRIGLRNLKRNICRWVCR